MSGISAENLARLTSASKEQKDAAIVAVLELAARVREDTGGAYLRSTQLLAVRFQDVIEEALK